MHLLEITDFAFYPSLSKFGNDDSVNKHICFNQNTKEGYLGIDIGSTSTNFVLIDKNKQVISS